MKKNMIISVIVIIIFMVIIMILLISLNLNDEKKPTLSNDEKEPPIVYVGKKAPIKIINECSDFVEAKIKFDMYNFDYKSNDFSTVYVSYKNISIEPGETWSYIFEAPESIDSQYLEVFLFPVRCGENTTSYSYSSTWYKRRADYYRVYETEKGIDIEWLGKP